MIRSNTLLKKKSLYILLLDYDTGSISKAHIRYTIQKMHCTNAINVQDDVGMIKIQGSKMTIQARVEW